MIYKNDLFNPVVEVLDFRIKSRSLWFSTAVAFIKFI